MTIKLKNLQSLMLDANLSIPVLPIRVVEPLHFDDSGSGPLKTGSSGSGSSSSGSRSNLKKSKFCSVSKNYEAVRNRTFLFCGFNIGHNKKSLLIKKHREPVFVVSCAGKIGVSGVWCVICDGV